MLDTSRAPVHNFEKVFNETGFVNVKAQKFRVLVGRWPKDEKHVCRSTRSSSHN